MKKLLIFFIILLISCAAFASKNTERQEIINILQKFQSGYTERNIEKVQSFVNDLFTEDILVIGTGNSEWLTDIQGIKRLVKNDWERWGDVKLDIKNVNIRIFKDFALIALKGTLTYEYADTESVLISRGTEDIKRILKNEDDPRLQLLQIMLDSAEILHAVEIAGSEFIFPLRVSATLIKVDGKWKFAQMTFSYPYPRRLITY
jgi:hypothetical protein